MAVLLRGREPVFDGRGVSNRIIPAPRLPPAQSLQARILAALAFKDTVSPGEFALADNATPFLGAVHALRRWRWPIVQWLRHETGCDSGSSALGRLDYTNRWGLFPDCRSGWPRMGIENNEGTQRALGVPRLMRWPCDVWPREGQHESAGHWGGQMIGCVHPDLAFEYMATAEFRAWRDSVLVDAMRRVAA